MNDPIPELAAKRIIQAVHSLQRLGFRQTSIIQGMELALQQLRDDAPNASKDDGELARRIVGKQTDRSRAHTLMR
jgi:hypothetical protein